MAVAGSRASIRAKVARRSRAMASWSVTYGITEEQRPTAIPQSQPARMGEGGTAPPRPNGVATTAATSMAAPSWSMPLIAPRVPSLLLPSGVGVGDPVAEDHVEHEAGTVGEGEHEPERFADDPEVGQRGDTADRDDQGEEVAAGAGPGGGQDDDAEELDGADRRQRQPVDGEVEQRVHRRQHGPQADQHQRWRGLERRDQPPRPAPEGEDHRRAGDPQPGDAQHARRGRTGAPRRTARGSGRSR